MHVGAELAAKVDLQHTDSGVQVLGRAAEVSGEGSTLDRGAQRRRANSTRATMGAASTTSIGAIGQYVAELAIRIASSARSFSSLILRVPHRLED